MCFLQHIKCLSLEITRQTAGRVPQTVGRTCVKTTSQGRCTDVTHLPTSTGRPGMCPSTAGPPRRAAARRAAPSGVRWSPRGGGGGSGGAAALGNPPASRAPAAQTGDPHPRCSPDPVLLPAYNIPLALHCSLSPPATRNWPSPCPEETLHPSAVTPHCLLPIHSRDLLSVSINLSLLDMSYK